MKTPSCGIIALLLLLIFVNQKTFSQPVINSFSPPKAISFTESMKSPGIPPTSALRTAAAGPNELELNLYSVNPDNSIALADGVREVFDNSYSIDIDDNDAKKITGMDLFSDISLGIVRGTELLAIEKRPFFNDTIYLNLSNTSQGNYQFQLVASDFSSSGQLFLRDNYLNTNISIGSNNTTTYNFSVTSDAASSASNRFRIITVVPATNITFSGKVILQGAYNTSSGTMSNTLTTSGILQANAASHPYTPVFNYTGTETVSSTFFASHPDIVDWVLVELRDAATPSTIIDRRAVFVKQGGTLVETDGTTSQITFTNVAAGNYFVSIRHRNHLGIRSAAPVNFSSGSASYDFTTSASQCFQNQSYTSSVQTGSVWSMRAGNANSNDNVKYNGPGNDQNQILNIKLGGSLSNILDNIYLAEDINMNGNVKWNGPGNDQNFLLNTLLGGSLSFVFLEQLF